MRDVAKLAGVSAQTVSRVSTGYPGVLEETRQAVIDAMKELGYRPNSAARALKWGHFKTIGVVMFTLSTSGNIHTLEAISVAAAKAGYAITLMPVTQPTPSGVQGAFTRLSELAVDGIAMVMEVHLLGEAQFTLPAGVPLVVADSDAGEDYTVIDTDQVAGARSATEHLLSLGHATVWHVAGPDLSFAAQRRADAWEQTLREHGARVPPIERGDWTATSGYEAGRRLAQMPDCTAIFVANDQMALGVMRALADAGRSVPDDVSVIGFDDGPDSAEYSPPLTTVHQDFKTVGELLVDGILSQLRGEEPQRGTTLVPTHLVLRDSTAAPRAQA